MTAALLAPVVAAMRPRVVPVRVEYTPPREDRAAPWQVAALVAWQLGGPGATVRRLHRAAERLARAIPSHPATLADAKRRAETILDAIADLPAPDRLPVVFAVIRELLCDVEEALELDQVCAEGARHHRVTTTPAQREIVARIVAADTAPAPHGDAP